MSPARPLTEGSRDPSPCQAYIFEDNLEDGTLTIESWSHQIPGTSG